MDKGRWVVPYSGPQIELYQISLLADHGRSGYEINHTPHSFSSQIVYLFSGWYLGCFNENRRDRAFNISAGNYLVSDTSARECTSACAFLNQSYAARDGDLCFCSNGPYDKYGSASSDNLCDAVCSNPCNDTSHVRVYSTQDAIGGLALPGPQIGWLFQEVNFTAFVAKGIIENRGFPSLFIIFNGFFFPIQF